MSNEKLSILQGNNMNKLTTTGSAAFSISMYIRIAFIALVFVFGLPPKHFSTRMGTQTVAVLNRISDMM